MSPPIPMAEFDWDVSNEMLPNAAKCQDNNFCFSELLREKYVIIVMQYKTHAIYFLFQNVQFVHKQVIVCQKEYRTNLLVLFSVEKIFFSYNDFLIFLWKYLVDFS